MPPVLVKTVERVMRGEEKREILARPADAMPGVDGEASLAVSRVVAEEARTGEGGAGGRAMTMETAIAGTEGGAMSRGMETTVLTEDALAPEMRRLKSGLKSMWMTGDYDRFSRYMEGSARNFYERLDVAAGSRLLDVACGAGQLGLIAAREGVDVTGVDIATNLLERARIRAAAEGLRATFHEADAEDLPFEEGAFDVVVSLIGAMFAPRPERVARELLRVCCPGGTIAMANWTADGFVGRMFKTISRFIAPSGMPSPLLWGDEATVRERLGPGVSELGLSRRHYLFDYPFPPEEVVEFFNQYYGPTQRAFATLEGAARDALRRELVDLWSAANQAGQGVTLVKAEYLEVIALRS